MFKYRQKSLDGPIDHSQSFLFNPLVILGVSIIATLALALVVSLLFDGERETAILAYSVPIAIPFVAYAFDRAQRWRDIRWAIDVPLVLVALSRAFVALPLISGHALFLTFALLTTRLPIARLTALLMLLYTIFLKGFVWRDVTLIGGILIGVVASYVYQKHKITGYVHTNR